MGDRITKGKNKKVPLPAGYSQMDWMRLCSKSENLSGLSAPSKHLTMAEVAKHNHRDDAWMILQGRVYNITPYLKFHPGSIEELMRGAGRDATAMFNEYHPWVNHSAMLEKCLVGFLSSSVNSFSPPQIALSRDEFRQLPLVEIFPTECSGVRRYRFAFPSELHTLGVSHAIRHVAVLATHNNKPLLREYTPSSPVTQPGYLDITIKVYNDGKMSQVFAHLNVGMSLSFSGPFGGVSHYISKSDSAAPTHSITLSSAHSVAFSRLVMVCAGSGITPMYQMLLSIFSESDVPEPQMVLVCSNRNADSVMLGKEVEELSVAHPNLRIGHVYSEVTRLSAEILQEHIGDLISSQDGVDDVVALICGPPKFNIAVEGMLVKLGVSSDRLMSL
eukprot:c6711_g1_i1.p1 GENE.c6711_g1_i1~~c6711_g1_i1.p1  ORF type:complete len:407 (+),score=82.51 c6711_g1_i1:59-1222(+)